MKNTHYLLVASFFTFLLLQFSIQQATADLLKSNEASVKAVVVKELPPADQIRATIVGEGGLEMNDGLGWIKISNGFLLPVGNSNGVRFRTLAVESSLNYPDGRTIALQMGTDITIFGAEGELSLNKGSIKIASGGSPEDFKVTTAGGVFIQETGTIYSVSFDATTKETTVAVEEGEVRVKVMNQERTTLRAGESRTFHESENVDAEAEDQAAQPNEQEAVELAAANVAVLSATAVAGEGEINVQSATYGGNCGAPNGNVTVFAKNACNGQTSCSYQISSKILGDPARNCSKDYAIHWTCGANSPTYELSSPAEAGLGSMLTLTCPPPSDAKTVSAGSVAPAATAPVPGAKDGVKKK